MIGWPDRRWIGVSRETPRRKRRAFAWRRASGFRNADAGGGARTAVGENRAAGTIGLPGGRRCRRRALRSGHAPIRYYLHSQSATHVAFCCRGPAPPTKVSARTRRLRGAATGDPGAVGQPGTNPSVQRFPSPTGRRTGRCRAGDGLPSRRAARSRVSRETTPRSIARRHQSAVPHSRVDPVPAGRLSQHGRSATG